MKSSFAGNKYLHTVASVGFLFTLNYDARSHELKKIILLLLFTIVGLLLGGNCYFTCIQNMKPVTTKFKSGGLHEKHVVATWNLGNHLSICF